MVSAGGVGCGWKEIDRASGNPFADEAVGEVIVSLGGVGWAWKLGAEPRSDIRLVGVSC